MMWCSAVGCIVTLTLSLLAAPLSGAAQPRSAVPRTGILTTPRRRPPRYGRHFGKDCATWAM